MNCFKKLFSKKEVAKEKNHKENREEKRMKIKALTQEERQGYYDSILSLSLVICDNNQQFHQTMLDYTTMTIDDFLANYEDLDNELTFWDFAETHSPDGIISPEIFGVACVKILDYYGFISSNDVNFLLEDMIFNFKLAFDYYQIDNALFDFAENDQEDSLMIWDSVNLVSRALPAGFELLNWQIDGDEYNFFILRENEISLLFEKLDKIDSLANIEITIVDPVDGLGKS